MAQLNPAPQSLFCVLGWKLGLHFIKKKKIHMFNHMWHTLLKYYCFVAVLWRKYSSWPWTSFHFPPLPDLNQMPFHRTFPRVESLSVSLSVIISYELFAVWIQAGIWYRRERKKSWMTVNLKRQLKVKLKSGNLEHFCNFRWNSSQNVWECE